VHERLLTGSRKTAILIKFLEIDLRSFTVGRQASRPVNLEPQPKTTPVWDTAVCDREPIHVPDSIQPHGLLLALREIP